jgi:hypothetical protein
MSLTRPKRAMETDPSVSSELSDQVDAVFAELEKTPVSGAGLSSVMVERVSVPSVSVESVTVPSASVASASVASTSVASVFVPRFEIAHESASDSSSSASISDAAVSSRLGRLDPRARARQLQLRLALTARAEGFDFARAYPGTAEAFEALDQIAEIALEHEGAGRTRMALDLYERLGAFED